MTTVAADTRAVVCGGIVRSNVCAAGPVQAEPAPVSFAGKQIRVSIGFSPTGFGYDTYGRLLARHMGKYLPGNPAIVPQNRPGAGSLNLANYLFNAAPKDGTEIALVGRGVAMEPLLGGSGSQAKFELHEVRLDRQHEQRGVRLLHSAARPGQISRRSNERR